ncbi:hypothetical protein KW797_02895 [Candidatus Parcubacteria bacterium]|nr:hypothetical protein [Candidatus Parcubacteria bacterium]
MENHSERYFIEQADRSREGLHPTLQSAHLEASSLIKEEEIDPEDFLYKRGYTAAQIEQDKKLVSHRESQFDTTAPHQKKMADVFEAIVLDQGERSNWFGQNAETIKTSRYDDIENGVDLIIEFSNPLSKTLDHLGLAVDVTFSEMKIGDKLQRIKKNIEKGKLAEIRYFHSEKEGVWERREVPRVVVGLQYDQMLELAALWLQQNNMQMKELRGKANRALGSHPAQRIILEQIALQLEEFKGYSEKVGKSDLAAAYEKDLVIIRQLIDEKEKEGIMLTGYPRDKIHGAIETTVATIFK